MMLSSLLVPVDDQKAPLKEREVSGIVDISCSKVFVSFHKIQNDSNSKDNNQNV